MSDKAYGDTFEDAMRELRLDNERTTLLVSDAEVQAMNDEHPNRRLALSSEEPYRRSDILAP